MLEKEILLLHIVVKGNITVTEPDDAKKSNI